MFQGAEFASEVRAARPCLCALASASLLPPSCPALQEPPSHALSCRRAKMPRKASTCAGFNVPPADWCRACKQKKGGCTYQGGRRPVSDKAVASNNTSAIAPAAANSSATAFSADAAADVAAAAANNSAAACGARRPHRRHISLTSGNLTRVH